MNWKNVFKTVFLSLLSVMILSACTDDDDNNKLEIAGTWVAVNSSLTPYHNQLFVRTYTSNRTAVQASRQQVENGVKWIEDPQYTYRIEDGILYEEGVDWKGKSFYRKSSIKLGITQDGIIMYVTELKKTYDGESAGSLSSYTMYNSPVGLYDTALLGSWKGKETTPGVESDSVRWHYMTDGTFDYYYYDKDQQSYVLKKDNQGEYFLYGNFFVSNFTNNLQTGGTGQDCECWSIYIRDGQMSWRAIRQGNEEVTFEMEKEMDEMPSWTY